MNPSSIKENLSFLWDVHRNVNNNIRFCDGKAGLILAASGVVLSQLFKQISEGNIKNNFQIVIFFICLFSIGVSFYLSFNSIFPRIKTGRPEGYIFWKHIAQYEIEEYSSIMKNLTMNDMIQELTVDVYELAQVSNDKYEVVQKAVMALVLAILLLITLNISFFLPT